MNTAKKHAGLTLLEVIIATSVLAMISAVMLTVLNFGARVSYETSRLNLINVDAQRYMEELVGRSWSGTANSLDQLIWADDTGCTSATRVTTANGFFKCLRYEVVHRYPLGDPNGEYMVLLVTVSIYLFQTSATPALTHQNIINVRGAIN